tara:strand:+ start:941 stop:2029 length:1089 start_codon:yes stop_codon:yes gene_type:complete
MKIILIILSLVNIVFTKFKNIKKSNYFVIDVNTKDIDQRSLNYIDRKNLNSTFNLIRTAKIDLRIFLNILRIPNFFCFTIFQNFFLIKFDKNKFFLFLKTILSYLRIKKFILIDDTRELIFFSKISKSLNIKNLIYMHGRFSSNSKIIPKIAFSKYLVWSNFFKEQLLKSNKFFSEKDILVVGSPYLKNFKKNKKTTIKISNCLILDEDFIDFKKVEKYYSQLKKKTKKNIYFKKKITRNIPKNFIKFCEKKNIQIIKDKKNLGSIIKIYDIDCIIASTSTGLLEASYYNIVPIKITSKSAIRENEFDIFVKNKFVYNASEKNFLVLLDRTYKIKNLMKIKSKLWGYKKFEKVKVKRIIENF